MRNPQKLISIAAVLALLLALVACSPSSTGSTPPPASNTTTASSKTPETNSTEAASDELIKIDVYNITANYQGVQGGWWGKLMKDKFNVEFNIIAPNVSGNAETLYQTRTAAGNLGDLLLIAPDQMLDCLQVGLIMDITDLVQDSQYLKEFDIAIDNMKEYLNTDRTYCIPNRVSFSNPMAPLTTGLNPFPGNFLRWDYYMEIGAPEINNMDDLLDVVEQMVQAHPTTENGDPVYGFSIFKDWDQGGVRLVSEYMFMYGYQWGPGMYWTQCYVNNDASDHSLFTDEDGLYKESLRFFNQAHRRGLLDPDSPTQNYDMVRSKVMEGRVMQKWWNWMGGSIHDVFNVDADIPYAYVPISNQQLVTEGFSPYGVECIALGVGCKNPERVIKFLDYYASPQGQLDQTHIEGLTYEMVDGRPVLTEFGLKATAEGLTVPEEYGGGTYFDGMSKVAQAFRNDNDICPVVGEPYNSALWQSTIERNANLYTKQWTEKYGTNTPVEYVLQNNLIKVAPGCSYKPGTESPDIAVMRSQCTKLVVDTSWKMLYANSDEEFEALWQDMQEQLPGFGYEEVTRVTLEMVKEIEASRAETIAAFNK